MKNFICAKLVLFCLFIASYSLKSQVPNPVSFNTAVDANLSGTIPLGNNDLSWTCSSVSISGPYVPAIRGSNQQAWLISPFPTANWITYPHTCTADPVDHTCVGAVDEYFKLEFNLPPTACNNSVNVSGGYCLTMNYFADNWVYEIFVNGVSSFVHSSPSSPYLSSGFVTAGGATVTLCDNWQAGTNTLVVHVKSGPPTLGFLAFITATATTPGGFTATATHTNVSCYSLANGGATLNLAGYTGPATYTWLPTGGNGPTASNLSPGIYTVNVQLPLCNLSSTLQVTQPASFAVNVSTTQSICKGTATTFTASGGETYAWSPGNQTGSVATFTPASTTVYTLTGTDPAGCKISTSFTQQVINCTGIIESVLQSVQISNISSGNLLIATNTENKCKAEIFELNGHLKYSAVITEQTEIDLSNWTSGIYVLKLSDERSSLTKRIIVDK